MIQISGPESIDVIQIGDIHVFLFGDFHDGKIGTCKPCKTKNNCYYITDFIDNLTLQPIELFLESPWLPTDYKHTYIDYVDKNKCVLSNVNQKYFHQMYLHSKENKKLVSLFDYFKKPKKTTTITRVHYTDIRTRPEFQILWMIENVLSRPNIKENKQYLLIYLYIIITFFPSCKHFKKFVDIVVLSNNFNDEMRLFFDNGLIDDDIKHFFDNSNIFNKFLNITKNLHKVRKQLLKIKNQQWKRALLRYYNYRCKFYFDNKETTRMFRHTCEQYDNLISTSGTDIPFDEKMFIISTMLLYWKALIMDMYHLARMLYYIEKGDAKVFVSYTGLAHTQFYKTFFTKYLKGKIIFSSIAKDGNKKKCLLIPEDIISKFMPMK